MVKINLNFVKASSVQYSRNLFNYSTVYPCTLMPASKLEIPVYNVYSGSACISLDQPHLNNFEYWFKIILKITYGFFSNNLINSNNLGRNPGSLEMSLFLPFSPMRRD
ncbi:hypothetical protein BpHYR1_046339 [Brachionus plicatilis]|uniref:Uncharacterized protein n=1 Tax=Brachionus plicatilis TaxID=10195 RepID=A0A3M7PHI8_BRAPC|nr:hypothetical protein BpHYR1_046339 [Brachionus plicatilis]